MKIIKESLNETLNPSEKVKMYRAVYDYVSNVIDGALDNIAIAMASDVPGYDASWCSDGQSKVDRNKSQYQDQFVISVVNVLLDALDDD
jgi:hypothetical protein